MLDYSEITVFYSSNAVGGGNYGRDGLHPVCHSCEKRLGIKEKETTPDSIVPAEAMPLIFSAELAAQQLGISLILVDIRQISVLQRLKFKLRGIPIPCVRIGDDFLSGMPTKDEIVEYYLNTINNG